MRESLNQNPVVQAMLVGVLAIAVAFLLMTRVMGGDDAAEPASGGTTVAQDGTIGDATTTFEAPVSGDAAADAVGTASGAAPSGDAEGAIEATAGAASTDDFAAGPGLPKPVVEAYEDGKAVAILITRKAGVEDKRLRAMISRIQGVGRVEVFHTYARKVARYSRITGGVDVSRVPALVVIRPRELTDGIPTATVSYGFRGPGSAEQAVRDSLYEGRDDIPYYPE